MKRWGPPILALLLSLFLFSRVQAQEEGGLRGIRLGPLKVFPRLGVGWERTDNLFSDDKGLETSALLNTVGSGLLIKLPLRRHSFQFGYGLNGIAYNRFHKHDDIDHSAGTALEFHFRGGLDLGLGHQFSAASSPPGAVEDHRSDYRLNLSSAHITYRLGHRLTMGLNYTYTDQDLNTQEDEEDSYGEAKVAANLAYRISSRTSILLESELSRRDNFDRWGQWVEVNDEEGNLLFSQRSRSDTDNDNLGLFLGLQWAATARLSGTLKGGYVMKKFEEGLLRIKRPDESRFQSTRPGENIKDFSLLIDLAYRLSHATQIELRGSRQIQETTVTTLIGRETGEGGDNEDRPRIGRANAAFGTHYISNDLALNLKHRFGYKMEGSFGVDLGSNDYPEKSIIDNKKRKDFRFGLGFGLKYQFQKRFIWSMGYRYTQNDSNIVSEDYQDNRFSTSFSLAF